MLLQTWGHRLLLQYMHGVCYLNAAGAAPGAATSAPEAPARVPEGRGHAGRPAGEAAQRHVLDSRPSFLQNEKFQADAPLPAYLKDELAQAVQQEKQRRGEPACSSVRPILLNRLQESSAWLPASAAPVHWPCSRGRSYAICFRHNPIQLGFPYETIFIPLCRSLQTGTRRVDAALGSEFVHVNHIAPWHGASQHRSASNNMCSPVAATAARILPGSGCALVDKCEACPCVAQPRYRNTSLLHTLRKSSDRQRLSLFPSAIELSKPVLPAGSPLKTWRRIDAGRSLLKGDFVRRACDFSCLVSQLLPFVAVLPLKKRRKMDAGRDPLKGGFVRAPKRGDAAEPLTEAEAAAAKIKPKVRITFFLPRRDVGVVLPSLSAPRQAEPLTEGKAPAATIKPQINPLARTPSGVLHPHKEAPLHQGSGNVRSIARICCW